MPQLLKTNGGYRVGDFVNGFRPVAKKSCSVGEVLYDEDIYENYMSQGEFLKAMNFCQGRVTCMETEEDRKDWAERAATALKEHLLSGGKLGLA